MANFNMREIYPKVLNNVWLQTNGTQRFRIGNMEKAMLVEMNVVKSETVTKHILNMKALDMIIEVGTGHYEINELLVMDFERVKKKADALKKADAEDVPEVNGLLDNLRV